MKRRERPNARDSDGIERRAATRTNAFGRRRKQLRKAKRQDVRGAERRRLAKVFSGLIEPRLKRLAARRVLWWARCLRTDARTAWREIRTDGLNKRAGIKPRDPGLRVRSLAPREDVSAPEARTLLYLEAAAHEIAKYACRLNAKDCVDEILFDLTFAAKYLAFWSWKGTLQDRRAALRMVMCLNYLARAAGIFLKY